ncbi:HD-GYP domain-containing protein [Clostridium sp.]|uniref:HD-GYP domain-containing protein n=1 Tax=Clostridium sp. TaxID=1506 RepID=UPI0039934736
MRLVPIEAVPEGCYLSRTIYDTEGRILLRKGTKLRKSLINRIKNLKIYSLYITDNYTDKEIKEIISPELKQKSILLVKDVFSTFSKISSEYSHCSFKDKMKLIEQKENYLKSIEELAEELYDNVISNKNLLVGLVDIKTMDAYTYQHSVNVALISIVIGTGFNLPKKDLIDLCVGALLHDLGKIFVGKKIIQKPGKLTSEEFEIIKTHPQKGFDYVLDNNTINKNCRNIIIQHHEKVDGTGYPLGLKSDKITFLAKIVAVADVYDALTSNRSYKRAMCPSEAFEFILSNANTMFDFEVTKVFAKVLFPYSEGTLVKLSNGEIGYVLKLHQSYPLRPCLKIIESPTKSRIGSIVDLSQELSLVICAIEF